MLVGKILLCQLLFLQEVDLAVAPFVFTPSKTEAVEFLFPLEEAEHSFIIKVPTENTLTMYFRPFQVTCVLLMKYLLFKL